MPTTWADAPPLPAEVITVTCKDGKTIDAYVSAADAIGVAFTGNVTKFVSPAEARDLANGILKLVDALDTRAADHA